MNKINTPGVVTCKNTNYVQIMKFKEQRKVIVGKNSGIEIKLCKDNDSCAEKEKILQAIENEIFRFEIKYLDYIVNNKDL